MNLLENKDYSMLGVREEKNKYEIDDNSIDISVENNSHSIIVRELLKFNKDIKVLDVGCGSGLIGNFFKKDSSVTIDGIEIDSQAREVAQKIGKYRNLYDFSIDEIDNYNVSEKYDAIIFADVLEHLINPDKTLLVIKKYLEKDGIILVSIPNISHINVIRNLINNNFNYNDIGILDTTHLRFFTDTSFLQMIRNVNTYSKLKYDVSFVANTIVLDDEIDSNSELVNIINRDNKKFILQNIFKLYLVEDEPKSLNNLLLESSDNIFELIDKSYTEQSNTIQDLNTQLNNLNNKNNELANEIEEESKKNALLLKQTEQLNNINTLHLDEINKIKKDIYEKDIIIEKEKNNSLDKEKVIEELDNENNNYYELVESLESNNRELLNDLEFNKFVRRDIESKYHAIVDSRIWKVFNLYFKGKDKMRNAKHKLLRGKAKVNAMFDNPSIDTKNFSVVKARIDVDKLVSKLEKYDIVSFDIFDTLIFRKVFNPTDVFQIIEFNYNIDNYSKFRVESESNARSNTKKKNFEINIFDIYNELKKNISFNYDELLNTEFEIEKEVCYKNDYMFEVFNKLKKLGKKIIITSDMYWPEKYLRELLNNCGYKGNYDLFVSCDYEINKGTGDIQKYISNKYKTKNIIHIGDNYYSDIVGSEKAKWHTYYYKNCREIAKENGDIIVSDSLLSSIISAIKINYLYNGSNKYNNYFKYGFYYAGQLTCGFLDHVDEIMEKKDLDKILFIARDAKIMHDVYNEYYAKYKNDYFVTSRSSMLEVSFEKNMKTFIDFYFKQRVAWGKHTIENTLIQTDLKFLLKKVSEYDLNLNDYLTKENYSKFEKLIYDNKKEIFKYFESSKKSAIKYFKDIIGESNKVLCVDLGWSGTIVTLLREFLKENVNENLEVYASFIGNVDNNKVNTLIDNGVYSPYCFSHLNKTRFLNTATLEGSTKAMVLEATFTSNEATLLKYDTKFMYGTKTNNEFILNEIHKGIKKFAEIYKPLKISGINFKINNEVAFGPMYEILNNYKYLYSIFGNFQEYKDSLPRFSGTKEITTLGKIIKDRGLL